MAAQEVTFCNDEEGWEFQTPIAPLLKNEFFATMLSGQFKESNTKRICLPGYSKSVLQQFIYDLTNTRHRPEPIFFTQRDDITLFNIQLTRLAHQLNQKDLIDKYVRNAMESTATRNRDRSTRNWAYDLLKLTVDLSFHDLKQSVFQSRQYDLDVMFELDDYQLLKAICHMPENNTTKQWIKTAIQNKAFKCLKIIFEEMPGLEDQYLQSIFASGVTLPEDLWKILITKYPNAGFINQLIRSRSQSNTVGALLRLMSDNFDFWHKVFEAGHLQLVKFAPNSMLIQNKGQTSFGTTAVTKGWFQCVELLLAAGWDPKPTNALDAAISQLNPKLIQMLLDKGAVPNIDTVHTMTHIYQSIRANYHAPPALACMELIEAATLANAFESDIYKAYAGASVTDPAI